MKIKLFFLSLILLLTASAVQANVMMPSMVAVKYAGHLLGAYTLVILSILLEIAIFRYVLKSSWQRIILAVLAMNAASAVVGLYLKFFLDFLLALPLLPLSIFGEGVVMYVVETLRSAFAALKIGHLSFGMMLYGVWYFFMSIAVNVGIEAPIGYLFVGLPTNKKKILYAVLLANVASVGFSLLVIAGYQMFVGDLEAIVQL